MKIKPTLCSVALMTSLFAFNHAVVADEKWDKVEKKVDSMSEQMSEDFDSAKTDALIMGKYLKDPLLSVFDIKVASKGDTVFLSGEVDSDLQLEKAVVLALSTKGVKNVDATGVTVKQSEKPFKDIYLSSKIITNLISKQLFSDQDFSRWSVNFETTDGKVFVTGTVDSKKTKEELLNTIHRVDGVKSIKEDIKVE